MFRPYNSYVWNLQIFSTLADISEVLTQQRCCKTADQLLTKDQYFLKKNYCVTQVCQQFQSMGAIFDLRKLLLALDWREPWWHDSEVAFVLTVLSSVSSPVELLPRAVRVPSTGIGSVPLPPPSSQSLPVLAALFPIVPPLPALVVFMYEVIHHVS